MKSILKVIFAIFLLLLISFSLAFTYNVWYEKESVEVSSHHNQYANVNSHLPIVVVNHQNPIKKESTCWAQIKIIDNSIGQKSFESSATIKYRGQSSYLSLKKQYRIELYKKQKGITKNNKAVMGMNKESDWILNGPFLDRSLIRNKLMYDLAKQLFNYAPDSRFCELFINDKYLGLYLMTEKIKVSDNRINLANFSLINGETAYLIRRERPGTEQNAINTYGSFLGYTSHELSIEYPSPKNLLDNQKKWIIEDVNNFERVLYSKSFANPYKGYLAYIDLQSFVDYYILNEFAMVKDAGYLSTYIYKNLAGKLKATVWDFNNCLDNYVEACDTSKFYVNSNNWFQRLLQDKYFVEAVVKRYYELRKGILSEKSLINKINSEITYLGDAVKRNYEVWGYVFETNMLQKTADNQVRDPKNYTEAVEQLKQTIIDRGKFLDDNITKLYENTSCP